MKRIVLIILIALSNPFYAQEVRQISKEEFIAEVKKNNLNIKKGVQDVLTAKGNFNQTNTVIFPSISVSHTGIITTNPLMAFGSKLNQETLMASDFNPTLLNNPSTTQNFATVLTIQQPLINLDGLYQRKAAQASLNAIKLQTNREKEMVLLEVEKGFLELQLAYKTVEILNQIKKAVLENRRHAENNFKQGYLQKSDLLAVEVRVLEIENQLQYANSIVEKASNYMSFQMNITNVKTLKPTKDLELNAIINFDKPISKDREDIKALEELTKSHKTILTASKLAFLPTLNAFGSYELYDKNVFKGSANGYVVGLKLNWNILEGTKRFGTLQKTKAAYTKSELEYEQYMAKSQLEYNNVKRNFKSILNQIELTKLALEHSKEMLRIKNNRFKQGLEKITDVLAIEAQYAEQQLTYYQAIYQYNYTQAYFQFLTKE